MTNAEKGAHLEAAVRRIEEAIISSSPNFSEGKFAIETRKIVTVQGVTHEFDVWVTVEIAHGYKAIFVFECRNRKEKVSKNDIIVFSAKVNAVQATGGFFVAKSFTEDAIAQLALDPRLKHFVAEELEESALDPLSVPVRPHFDRVPLGVKVRTDRGFLPVHSFDWPFVLNGRGMTLGAFVSHWASEAKNVFPTLELLADQYSYAYESIVEFANREAYLCGVPVRSIEIYSEGEVTVDRAVLISGFNIESRGRTYNYEFTKPLAPVNGIFADIASMQMTFSKIEE